MFSPALALLFVPLVQALPAIPSLHVAGESPIPSQVQKVNIFQGENRQEIKNPKDGWRSIGLLYSPISKDQSIACTASLVGPDLILTSGACITERGRAHPQENQFFLQYNTRNKKNPMPYHAKVRKIWLGTNEKIDSSNFHKNWAILRLDTRLGDRVGWMAVIKAEATTLARLPSTQPLHMAGYSLDVGQGTVPLLQKGCKINGFAAEPIYYHNCSGIHFSHGSPLVVLRQDPNAANGGATVVGINMGGMPNPDANPETKIPYDLDVTNLAIGTDDLIDKLLELRAILD